MARHIIHKQKIRLELSDAANASTIQNKVSDLFHNGLTARLEKALDEIVPENKWLRLESLHLNLGVIDLSQFEQEFERILTNRWRDAITVEMYNSSHHDHNRNAFEALTRFLDAGILPWWAEINNIQEWEKELVSDAGENDWKFLTGWLRNNSVNRPSVIKRLVWQFSDDLLEIILGYSSPAFKPLWTSSYRDFQQLLKNQYALNPEKIRNNVWEYSLQEILAAEPSTHASPEKLIYLILRATISGLGEPVKGNAETGDGKEIIQPGAVRSAFNKIQKEKVINQKDKIVSENQVSGKKSQQPGSNLALEGSLYVKTSGVVILYPFLQLFFEELGWVKAKSFLSETFLHRAVLILYYLSTGQTQAAEYDLVLEKILCGMPLEDPIPQQLEITEQEKAECEQLLHAVINNWPPLKNTTIEGLRTTFLQREGRLDLSETGWSLYVEKKTVDILFDKMPWGFSIVKLPWMKNILSVEWA